MPNLLLTSYKLHDAIHEQASDELSEWLHAHAKKWKVQVKWKLPDKSTKLLTELVTVLRAMLPQTQGKRAQAVERLIGEIVAVLPTTTPVPTAAEVVANLSESVHATPVIAVTTADIATVANQLAEADQTALKEMLAQVPAGVPAEAVELVEAALASTAPAAAPKAPEKPSEAPQATPVPMAAQVTCPARPVALRRLEPEERPALPPPEQRAKKLLGDLFRRLSSGE